MTSKFIVKQNKSILESVKDDLRLVSVFFGNSPCEVTDGISKYSQIADELSSFEIKKLKAKMLYFKLKYGFVYDEFFDYRFIYKSKKQCLEYISNTERLNVYRKLFSNAPEYDILHDKRETYKMFKKYFKRDTLSIDNFQDLINFSEFIKKHNKIIVKPSDSNNGAGIFIIDFEKEKISGIDAFKKCLFKNGALIEEFINQPGVLNNLYPYSVNTVRFITYFDNDRDTYDILASFLRMGFNKSQVDNSTIGGLSAAIDINTGIIRTDGYKENTGKSFEFHPDTGYKIKGVQLPDWNELHRMLDEIVRINPDLKFVGWDFAYSDKGWMLVEANRKPGFYAAQMCNESGLRPIFEKTLYKEL